MLKKIFMIFFLLIFSSAICIATEYSDDYSIISYGWQEQNLKDQQAFRNAEIQASYLRQQAEAAKQKQQQQYIKEQQELKKQQEALNAAEVKSQEDKREIKQILNNSGTYSGISHKGIYEEHFEELKPTINVSTPSINKSKKLDMEIEQENLNRLENDLRKQTTSSNETVKINNDSVNINKPVPIIRPTAEEQSQKYINLTPMPVENLKTVPLTKQAIPKHEKTLHDKMEDFMENLKSKIFGE